MPLTPEEIKTLQDKAAKADAAEAKQKELQAEIEKLKAGAKVEPQGSKDDGKNDSDLNDTVAREKKDREAKAADSKRLEAALTFTLQSDKFIKDHESVLPKDMTAIFEAASKETYDSAVEKSNAIKSALISSFFKVQAHQDALTASQKSAVEDFEKLTKRGREEKAEEVFTNIFEPALATMKLIKKAEQVQKSNSGLGEASDGEKKYADRMTKFSQNHYGIKEVNHGA